MGIREALEKAQPKREAIEIENVGTIWIATLSLAERIDFEDWIEKGDSTADRTTKLLICAAQDEGGKPVHLV